MSIQANPQNGNVSREEETSKSGRANQDAQAKLKITRSCILCKEADNDNMVQCDNCDKWFHFICVGVDEKVAYIDWACKRCQSKEKLTKKSSSSSVGNSRRKLLQEELEKINEERIKRSEEMELLEKRIEAIGKILLEEEYKSHNNDVNSNLRFERTSEWVLRQQETTKQQELKFDQFNYANSKRDLKDDICQQAVITDDKNSLLTSQQIAARQVLSTRGNLPFFNGNPTDWPMFFSSYLESTKRCGYTNQENLIRLQQCLKGKALDAVRSMLLIPETVPIVIENLKMLFGRPEIIINTLISKIRNEKSIRMDRMDLLINFAMMVQNLVATMEASKLNGHLNNPILLQELVAKLPPNMRLDWARYIDQFDDINLTHFNKWLYQQAQAASKINFYFGGSYGSEEKSYQKESKFLHVTDTDTKSINKICSVCKSKSHIIVECPKFIDLNKNQRWNLVKEKKLCWSCLKSHFPPKCQNKKICSIDGCQKYHHPLLHNPNYVKSVEKPKTEESLNKIAHYAHFPVNQSVLFRIVPVKIFNDNNYIETFAFLDDGSSVSLMEENLAKDLMLDGPKSSLHLQWSNDISREEDKSMTVSCEISGTTDGAVRYQVMNIRTVKKLGLPIQSIQLNQIRKYCQYLHGLPLQSYVNASPRLLIGLDNFKLCVPLEIREKKDDNLPIATRTRLGWVLSGPSRQKSYLRKDHTLHICECQKEDENLHKLFKEFSSIENFGVKPQKKILESKDDSRARDILTLTTVRKEGRFETGLLWKQNHVKLPDSFQMAFKRLLYLEKKMSQDRHMAESLRQQLKEYEEKKYIRKLKAEEVNLGSRIWYLPIFIVRNPNKPKKMRIVWDAAAQVEGISLNSMLLPGPDLMSSLISILHRFRQGKFAICGDIKEMFHQVLIREDDQHSQRFLWRNVNFEQKLDIYVMRVMTFGATCSPSSAQFVKNLNAEDFKREYPRAVEAIQENHYVDDWLDSFDNEDEAIQVAKDVKFVHSQGGFEIRNWMSNSRRILSEMDEEHELSTKNLNEKESTGKILGMWWNTTIDIFTYKINRQKIDTNILNGSKCPTKREVLRTLMCIYDPLGLIGNFLVYLKILLQDIWRSAITWDEKIKEEHYNKWKIWTEKLWSFEKLQIPRHYGCSSSSKYFELHTFVDASEYAYSAVVYLRSEDETGVHCALVGSKTKVAPLKPISVPRLELLAAVLGARLANTVREDLTIQIYKNIYWTDSKTVLYWLKSEPRKYRQFVALRIGELLELTNLEEWHWVTTSQNIADEATKWKNDPQFCLESRWFTGPQFLRNSQKDWPIQTLQSNLDEDNNELRVVNLVHHQIDVQEPVTPNINHFSKWRRLVRSQAYLLRSVTNFKTLGNKKKTNKKIGPLLPEEIKTAELMLYRKAQWDCYQDEIIALSTKPPCKIEKDSQLYNMNPYLEEGILRIHGRIDAAQVQYDVKRPIILPSEHPITNLIITEYHEIFHHKNNEIIINEIRQKYIIPKLRVLVKKIKNICQKCKNDRATPKPPLMGELPKARLSAFQRPFTFVGIDYFGPMEVTVGRRTEKRWGVLFTCLTIRAIHIEIANSLSTNACIQCIKQFIFTRGCPLEIYTDNGTNFRGARNELHREIQKIEESKLVEYSSRIKWIFIPPATPHMGGSWERLIRSVKSNLMEILKTNKPKEEVLRCSLKEIEFIINSRPLTYLPLDSEEDEALTPNHFLLGTSNGIKPPAEFHNDETTLKNNWRSSQMMVQQFWKRWVQEYLPTLTRRTKWFEPTPALKLGDLVIIIDAKNPRNVWPKGIVVDIIRGKDGHVRSAVIKTKQGLLTRPTVKLAVLDVLK